MTTSTVRRAVRWGALSAAASYVLVASPASADVTEGWSDPAPVDTMNALLVFGAIPLATLIVIAVLGILPKKIRGEKILDQPVPGSDQWIGGPTTVGALKPGETTEGTGGASGTF